MDYSFNDLLKKVNNLLGEGKWDDAAFLFLRALDYDADKAWSGLWLAAPWEFFTALLPLNLDRWEYLHRRTKIESLKTLIYLGEYQRVLDLLPDLEQILPGSRVTLSFHAQAHYGLGNYRTCVEYVDKIEDTCLDMAEEWDEWLRILSLYELMMDERFESCLAQFLSHKADPDTQGILLKSFYLRNLGKYGEALAAAEEALMRLEHPSSVALFQRLWCLRATGDVRFFSDAVEYLSSSAYRDETYDYYKPFVYCYLHEDQKAISAAKEYFARHIDSSEEGYLLCAEIYSLLGNTRLACECLDMAMRKGLRCRNAGLLHDPALAALRETSEGSALINNYLNAREAIDRKASESAKPDFVDTPMFIPATVGEKISVRLGMQDRTFGFLIDTASPRTLVSYDPLQFREKSDIRRVLWRMQHHSQQCEYFCTRHRHGYGKNLMFHSLETAGTTILKDIPVVVMNGNSSYKPNVLGQDILSRFSTVAIASDGTVELSMPHRPKGEFAVLPFKWLDGQILVPCTIEGTETYAVLDTGSSRSLIPSQLVKKKSVHWTKPTPNSAEYCVLPELKLADLTINNVDFHSCDIPYPHLGFNLLCLRFARFTIDYAGCTVNFEKYQLTDFFNHGN